MPAGHGRRRHAGRTFARPTHSGFRALLFGGQHVPAESGGAMGAVERTGLDYEAARDGEQAQMPDIGPEAVDAGNIRARSLTRSLFAETIIPPEVVDALPTLPDASYPQGVLVFLTTDMKLYRNTDGSTWSVEVDGADITANSITAGQIAAGAIGTTELAADAVIANVANVGDTVTIDDTGITITDGALTFLDNFGETVLTGAGFGATWMDFLNSLVYNSRFAAGTTSDIVIASEVSGGDSIADYEASISSSLPYWVVSFESGVGTFKRVADTATPSGFALEWSGDESAQIYQDIPVTPGQVYGTYLTWKYTNSSSSFFSIVGCQFRDKDHAAISGEGVVESSLLYNTSSSGYITQGMNWSSTAPATARFLRVFIQMTRSTGSPVVRLATVNVIPMNIFGSQRIVQGATMYDDTFGISWNNGTTVDVTLTRTGTNRITVGSGALTPNSGNLDVIDTLRTGQGPLNTEVNINGAGFIQMREISAPVAPAGDRGNIFMRDNGSGKTQLCVRFSSGAIQVIATQP